MLAVANLSIGQGSLMMSPLEIARITAVMCNGGYLVNPTLYYGTYIDGVIDNQSGYSYKSKIIDSETAALLKEMCMYCVSDGTGKEILNTYFTGFYPADDPQYVITVFAANGESGSKTCAPVFKEMCDFIAQNY